MEPQALVSPQAWVLAVGGGAAAIALLRWLGQRSVSVLPVLSALLAGPGGTAWELSHTMRAWLRARLPLLYGLAAARLRPGRFTGLPLTLLILAAAYLATLLGGLAQEVIEAEEVLRFDEAVNRALADWRHPAAVAAFLWITALGAGPALAAVAAVATGFLWAERRTALIAPFWLVFLGAQATTWAGKYAIARHRPVFIDAVAAASPSFPSGHATGAMAVYGFLAYALVRELPDRRERFEICYWTAMLILLVGFSRVLLSVHYATDVAAGILVGGFWLLAGFAFAEWSRSRPSAA